MIKVQDLDEALQLIRNQVVGKDACIFTQNLYYTEKFISDANAGMVGVNAGVCAPHPYLALLRYKRFTLYTNKVQGKNGIDFFTQNKIANETYQPYECYRAAMMVK